MLIAVLQTKAVGRLLMHASDKRMWSLNASDFVFERKKNKLCDWSYGAMQQFNQLRYHICNYSV